MKDKEDNVKMAKKLLMELMERYPRNKTIVDKARYYVRRQHTFESLLLFVSRYESLIKDKFFIVIKANHRFIEKYLYRNLNKNLMSTGKHKHKITDKVVKYEHFNATLLTHYAKQGLHFDLTQLLTSHNDPERTLIHIKIEANNLVLETENFQSKLHCQVAYEAFNKVGEKWFIKKYPQLTHEELEFIIESLMRDILGGD